MEQGQAIPRAHRHVVVSPPSCFGVELPPTPNSGRCGVGGWRVQGGRPSYGLGGKVPEFFFGKIVSSWIDFWGSPASHAALGGWGGPHLPWGLKKWLTYPHHPVAPSDAVA